MDQKHKGALAEMQACAWLLDKGYEVFRNVSQHGLADIVAVNFKTGEKLYIDVKSMGSKLKADGTVSINYNPLSDEQKELGIRLLLSGSRGYCELVDPQRYAGLK